MLRLGAPQNDGNAFLRQKAQQDLRGGLAVSLGQRQHGRLSEHLAAAALSQRRISHVRHLLFVHPASFGTALAVEIGFDLVHCRNDLIIGNQIKELIRLEVGNADGADPALRIQVLQNPPRRVVVGKRPVQKQQVDIVRLQSGQGLPARRFRRT